MPAATGSRTSTPWAVQQLLQASVTRRARKDLLSICYDMLEPSLADRIDTSSVLCRMYRFGDRKDNPKVGLFCEDCSVKVDCKDTVTQEELVDDCTELSLDANPTADIVISAAEIGSATKEPTKKHKNKGTISSTESREGNEPTILQNNFSFRTPRYYCTACGELGHNSSRCPNECWACVGDPGHWAAQCPKKRWEWRPIFDQYR
ncbi:hypothetical protein HBH56_017720 [Parastagonospora nodorum]|nr:hypothetical protein HBH56_017720 [Parastagonospora nodorum]KAH4137215.1 hypothetical protein HBH45_124030 [Parastagonospora nodorum]KAH4173173.1 hypothetical protein HBH44_017230 [Parastagonospora nodorum]KAH4186798.1 hypothetical protein HBI95_236860 [Parastagonospora nodorum]KAH4569188.1 hypothetical protein HBH84_125470 [Parastagonospora nodorum]